MTLEEKIGQLNLINSDYGTISSTTRKALQDGAVGGILNEVDPTTIKELQRIAIEDSRLGIPLLAGRDIIHGFRTIFPIPLGLAATWNEELGEHCGHISAAEATSVGLNWTFAPIVDICRDPRWGRVAESFGEDPYLCSQMAIAMIKGFQGESLELPGSMAVCLKHFAGYGACESGKDYNTTNIPENELRNVHLPPFKAAIDAGALSLMTSFSDLDGVPATANSFILQTILRDEWIFDGIVVSDWESVSQLIDHGFARNEKEAAYLAASAGIDMEMTSTTFTDNLSQLIDEGKISIDDINRKVANILRLKFRLGLFDINDDFINVQVNVTDHKKYIKEAAIQSCVLLKNKNKILPLKSQSLSSIAVIGPLSDEPHEQLGTWVFDGDVAYSETPLKSLQASLPDSIQINYIKGLENSRSKDKSNFTNIIQLAEQSDLVLMFMGEEAILAGEAHCRADIRLPGAQEELIDAVSKTGKPIVLIIMTGRPLALESVVDKVDAILCAWHPGSYAGPAIIDLLLGVQSPSGKLPITFPRITGQIPIYYSHKNTGRPGTPESITFIDDIDVGAPQHSFGNTSFHLDIPNSPLFPFGFGLSYTTFKYENLKLSDDKIILGNSFTVSVELTNSGDYEAMETVQLYIRDLVGSVTRPVKELKKFKKVSLKPNEKVLISFELSTDDLAFYGRDNIRKCETGEFHLWVGSSSNAELITAFEVIE